MVQEAEKYKAENGVQHDKGTLESYAFNVKLTVEDEKFLDKNQIRRIFKKLELEVCKPTITKLYQSAGGGSPTDGGSSEPTIEEVD
uniref:Uncharacterized protein n=1 Tax=Amphilophus citrinellus TaxID=61819 RepID=A0A3Q0SXH7_AMPCI